MDVFKLNSIHINKYSYYREYLLLGQAEIGVRVQFRCELVVRRMVNRPELESDPIFFASAGRSFTRPPTLK
jgi:hypothetical protein